MKLYYEIKKIATSMTEWLSTEDMKTLGLLQGKKTRQGKYNI